MGFGTSGNRILIREKAGRTTFSLTVIMIETGYFAHCDDLCGKCDDDEEVGEGQ